MAKTDGDGSLTIDFSNESSSLSLSDKPLLMLHIQNTKQITKKKKTFLWYYNNDDNIKHKNINILLLTQNTIFEKLNAMKI